MRGNTDEGQKQALARLSRWHRGAPCPSGQLRCGLGRPPSWEVLGWGGWRGMEGRWCGWEEVREVPQIPAGPDVASAGAARGQCRQHPCGVLLSAVTATRGESRSATPWETGRRNWKSACPLFPWHLDYFQKQPQSQQQVEVCYMLSHVAAGKATQAGSILTLNERWGFWSNN